MSIRRLTENEIKQIRERVLSGKNKNQVAKEFGVSPFAVHSHTKDISCEKNQKYRAEH